MSDICQMTDAEYFSSPAIDQSALKQFMLSPLAYVDYLENGLHVSQSALDFGSIAHSLVLGTDGEYAIKPNLRTKAGKEEFQRLQESNALLISESDLETAKKMAAVTSPYFKSIPGKPEVAIFAQDTISGLDIKGKVDWLPSSPDDDNVFRIRDYKTTRDNPQDFSYTAYKLGYHIQAAFYMMLYRLATGFDGEIGFEFVVQQKQRPFDFMVWRFSEDQEEIEIAREHIAQSLDEIHGFQQQYADWKRGMSLFGLNKSPQTVSFTGWQIDKEAEGLEDE